MNETELRALFEKDMDAKSLEKLASLDDYYRYAYRIWLAGFGASIDYQMLKIKKESAG